MRRRRRARRALRDDIVLTGLDSYPAPDSLRNMAGYDQCPPALRQKIANNPHPMIFAETITGQPILVEIRQC
jgi:hypothetical protein